MSGGFTPPPSALSTFRVYCRLPLCTVRRTPLEGGLRYIPQARGLTALTFQNIFLCASFTGEERGFLLIKGPTHSKHAYAALRLTN